MMENLVPREAYGRDDGGNYKRLGLMQGVFFGTTIGTACFFLIPATIEPGWRFLLSISAGILCGVIFGKISPRRFRKRMSSMIDRLYSGDSEIASPLPPEKDLRYRLPCSWKRSENFAVGGILYIGPQVLLFAPHKKNLPRDRSSFEMGPSKTLKLSLTPQKPAGFFKLFAPRPPLQLLVVWTDGNAKFLIPAPTLVLKLIEERIGEME